VGSEYAARYNNVDFTHKLFWTVYGSAVSLGATPPFYKPAVQLFSNEDLILVLFFLFIYIYQSAPARTFI